MRLKHIVMFLVFVLHFPPFSVWAWDLINGDLINGDLGGLGGAEAIAYDLGPGDYQTGGNNEEGTTQIFNHLYITNTGCVDHFTTIAVALQVDQNYTLNHGYVYAAACDTKTITAHCVKFKQSAAELATAGCTISDQGGVEYDVDCGLLPNGWFINPKCNRCTGDE